MIGIIEIIRELGKMAVVMALFGIPQLLNGAQAAPIKKTPEQIRQVCDKAEQRYQKIFGLSSSSEKVAIVLMHKYTFCPDKITIKQGQSVRWVNVDKRTSHSTWFKQAGKEESERLFSAEKAEMKFDLPPGDYPYLCGPHWESDGMIGTVTVTP